MRVVIPTNQRCLGTADGVYSDGKYANAFWSRYLDVFDEAVVIARVKRMDRVPEDWKRVDGGAVTVAPVPYFVGPWQYLRSRRSVRSAVRSAVRAADAVILRLPGELATCLEGMLLQAGRPYGVEVVGDPYDVFAPGSVKSVLRPLLRAWYPRRLRRQCANACAASYVTEHSLQRRYPPPADAFATHYSSIELGDEAFVAQPRPVAESKSEYALAFVGTLAQLYKAPDVLIDAVARCVSAGRDLRLTLVGDGKHRGELEQRAAAHGLAERVRFAGQLSPGPAVWAELDRADLFVLPSHQEGLPRAMIEAMARGLACIGSTVGGIPELLPSEEMVPPGDADALAERIGGVLSDPPGMARMSARNLEKARAYHAPVLRQRRREMYQHVREMTEQWLARRGGQ